ncbi:MAG TPA: NPCBM/NEW2 domain-containing protein [Verrucomicrobiae bacterium]
MKSHFALALGFALAAFTAGIASAETVWLDDLNLAAATQGWGKPHKNQSVEGHTLTIGGKTFERGFGTHAEGTLRVNLGGGAQKFSASVGVDDEVNKNPAASVEFIVRGDGKTLWHSGVMKAGDAAKDCEVDLTGVKSLVLQVSDAGDGNSFDHADWADAKFETASAKNFATGGEPAMPLVAPYILTPAAPTTPRINGANVFGVRPGSPFLFTIPATGERPMEFSIETVSSGLAITTTKLNSFSDGFISSKGNLHLNSINGQITGSISEKGEYKIVLCAKNSKGEAKKDFRIVVGDQIALTPPMGWNSWNCFAGAVSADRVKRAANALVKSGLVNHGWSYINIDDFWQNHRDAKDPTLRGEFRDTNGVIVPNSRFPDMKGLADYVHNLGLKIGLYSSPGPWTCGGCAGSFDHESQDAQTYAQWGFDYLKYDWCSYNPEMEDVRGNPTNYPVAAKSWGGFMPSSTEQAKLIKPYELMGKCLRAQNRDIVFSLCQYGMGDVWQWGGSVNGNCWRTTGDITDTWRSMSGIGFHQDQAAPFAKPGNWNDPDMLIVGEVGWGKTHPSRLTPDEQYTHISLWCLLSAPLLIGCDMEKFDDFTLNLLGNDEVLALDQDALGKEAMCVATNGDVRIYAKELEDGGRALGFFNLGLTPTPLDLKQLTSLGFGEKQRVRNLWRQLDVPVYDMPAVMIPAHGVVLYKLTAVK